MRVGSWLLGWALCLTTGWAGAEDLAPADLLKRMASAQSGLNYQGVFIYQHDGRLDTMRVYHARDDQGERERLVGLNGERREVVRDSLAVTCIGVDGPIVYGAGLDRRLAPLAENAPLPALDHYALEVGAEDRVAGHTALVLEVRARDAFRYGHRLWLEKESALLLRSMLLAPDGEAVEQLMFTSLEIGVRPDQSDLVGGGAEPRPAALVDDEQAWNAAPAWSAFDLPAGFRLLAVKRPAADQSGGTEHLVYSDGIAHVSVYVEPRNATEAAAASVSRRGAVSVYAGAVEGHGVTVLGEVPVATVERIGRSVRKAAAVAGG